MDAVVRALVIYAALMVLIRIAGKRAITQMDTFDFILLLVVSEATEHAMLGEDHSIVNTLIVITTLFAVNIGLSLWKRWAPDASKWLTDRPLVVVEDGRPLEDRLHRARVDEEDILAAARELQGLERMDQIKYAVLESTGGISIIPKHRKGQG